MRKSKSAVMRTYDAIARDFDVTRYRPWPETLRFAEMFSEGQHLLDLGCGNGRDLRFLEGRGLRVTGMDISVGQLRVVKARAGTVPALVQGDVCALPFRDGIADGAILAATLHHLPSPGDRLKALAEARRCLKPGGRCLLGVWAAEQDGFRDNIREAREEFQEAWEPGDMLLDWKMPDGRIFKRYYHLFSEEEFDRMLTSTDFLVEERHYSAGNHYAILMVPLTS